jgi:large conductance mechanosensitive channel
MSIIKEFKEFAMRGNVVDLAVGVIIGAAFGKVVGSVVNDIIMPPIGLLIGGMDFKNIVIVLRDAVSEPGTGKIITEAVTLRLGNFIQTLVDFTIIAFAIFLMINAINKLSRKKEEEPLAAPPEPSKEESLLTEIRDILKNKQ